MDEDSKAGCPRPVGGSDPFSSGLGVLGALAFASCGVAVHARPGELHIRETPLKLGRAEPPPPNYAGAVNAMS